MTVPTAIADQVSALAAATTAAGDLTRAPFSTINALAYQAGLLAGAAEEAIGVAAGGLDTFAAPIMPADIEAGVLALSEAADTQQALAELEGYAARIEIVLENR